MDSAPPSTAVGIDLGSATTTVMVRRSGDRTASNVVDPVPDQFRAGGTFSAALVVPASWDDEKRAEHIEAAARAGFDRVGLVPEPEAAARYYTEIEERELEPGTPLIVFGLGAESCNVGIVTADGEEYEIHAAADADGVGGRRFDELLLEYLADWHRSTSPAFWLRIDAFGPNSERAALLDQIRAARERLSVAPTATIDIPGRELTVTRAELETVIADTVAETADLAERTFAAAGLGPARRAELMLIGGASRTPLVAQTLADRFGIEPFVPEMPDLVAAEGAAVAAAESDLRFPAAAEPVGAPKRSGRRRGRRLLPLALVAGAVLLAAAVVAAHQVLIGPPAGDGDRAGGIGGGETTLEEYASPPPTPPASESPEPPEPTGEDGGAPATEAPSDEPEPSSGPGQETGPDPGFVDPTPADPTTSEESAHVTSTGTVPDVTGRTLAEAERMLAEAGFTEVTSHGYRWTGGDRESADCEVAQQSPRGGQERPHDEEIALTYTYMGTDTC